MSLVIRSVEQNYFIDSLNGIDNYILVEDEEIGIKKLKDQIKQEVELHDEMLRTKEEEKAALERKRNELENQKAKNKDNQNLTKVEDEIKIINNRMLDIKLECLKENNKVLHAFKEKTFDLCEKITNSSRDFAQWRSQVKSIQDAINRFKPSVENERQDADKISKKLTIGTTVSNVVTGVGTAVVGTTVVVALIPEALAALGGAAVVGGITTLTGGLIGGSQYAAIKFNSLKKALLDIGQTKITPVIPSTLNSNKSLGLSNEDVLSDIRIKYKEVFGDKSVKVTEKFEQILTTGDSEKERVKKIHETATKTLDELEKEEKAIREKIDNYQKSNIVLKTFLKMGEVWKATPTSQPKPKAS